MKQFKLKGVFYTLFDENTPRFEIENTLKKLRVNRVEPNMIKYPHIKNEFMKFSKEWYVCNHCGELNNVKFMKRSFDHNIFCLKEECQKEQISFNKIHMRNVQNTLLKNYGVEVPAKNGGIAKKQSETARKKFKEKSFKNNFVSKIAQTKLKKYGDPKYNNRDKLKETLKSNPDIFLRQTYKKYGENLNHREKLLDKEFWVSEFIKDDVIDFRMVEDFFGIKENTVKTLLQKMGLDVAKKKYKCLEQFELFKKIKCANKRFNDKKILKNRRELDITLPDYKIAIEYDGLVFHSEGISKYAAFNTPEYNHFDGLNKECECEKNGWKLYRVFSSDNIDAFISIIHSKIGVTPPSNENFEIREISHQIAEDFIDSNYLTTYENCDRYFGVFSNELIYVFGIIRNTVVIMCPKIGTNIVHPEDVILEKIPHLKFKLNRRFEHIKDYNLKIVAFEEPRGFIFDMSCDKITPEDDNFTSTKYDIQNGFRKIVDNGYIIAERL